MTAADKMMFKSLISSQEFSLGGLLAANQVAAAQNPNSILTEKRDVIERSLPGS